MKYLVKVQGRQFEVEIGNLSTQPIIALVDGEPLEIWVEQRGVLPGAGRPHGRNEGAFTKPAPRPLPAATNASNASISTGNNKTIRAPIPGTILSVLVSAGTEVTIGQDVCTLEAMKMKNAIRSPRKGVIAAVHVTPGQTVQHRDILVEFTE